MSDLILRVNARTKSSVLSLQEYFVLAWNALRFIFARPFYGQDIIQQMDEIGVKSLGIVLLTGTFTGMVLALSGARNGNALRAPNSNRNADGWERRKPWASPWA